MKKVLCVILVAVICLSFSSCGDLNGGSSSLYAKVTYSDGSSETLDVGEIPDLVWENQFAYNQKYAGNKIEVVDEIRQIGSLYGSNGYISIDTKNGWNFMLDSEDSLLVDLREGTLVKIVGKMLDNSWSISYDTIEIID